MINFFCDIRRFSDANVRIRPGLESINRKQFTLIFNLFMRNMPIISDIPNTLPYAWVYTCHLYPILTFFKMKSLFRIENK